MKNERQEKILAIIAASAIETQEQLIDSLRKEGISCTQATISRDIKQLHLIKEPTGNGTYRYAVSTQKMRLNLADRLQTILRESIVSVDCRIWCSSRRWRVSAPQPARRSTGWISPPRSALSRVTTRC
jgi:transcriptional regulator of arginine metabolism